MIPSSQRWRQMSHSRPLPRSHSSAVLDGHRRSCIGPGHRARRRCPVLLPAVNNVLSCLYAGEGLTFCQTLDPRVPLPAIAWSMTDPAPADSPAMVTFAGSPPNLEMCVCTQSKANAWSRRPALTTPLLLTSADERNPNAPSCAGRFKSATRSALSIAVAVEH